MPLASALVSCAEAMFLLALLMSLAWSARLMPSVGPDPWTLAARSTLSRSAVQDRKPEGWMFVVALPYRLVTQASSDVVPSLRGRASGGEGRACFAVHHACERVGGDPATSPLGPRVNSPLASGPECGQASPESYSALKMSITFILRNCVSF